MLEEEHGSPRRAMNIYNRATTAVEKHEIYKVRISVVELHLSFC